MSQKYDAQRCNTAATVITPRRESATGAEVRRSEVRRSEAPYVARGENEVQDGWGQAEEKREEEEGEHLVVQPLSMA